jgi:hypothetical protein
MFAPPVGLNVVPIDPGDFTIDQYKPWVVNNNKSTNNVIGPDGSNNSLHLTNVDAGGADILLSYTPLNDGDPTKVNFVQAFIQNTNHTRFTKGKIDNDDGPTPYYNEHGKTGTGKKSRNRVPLKADSTTAAWLIDIPGRCENGLQGPSSKNCQDGKDETITSQVQMFQTFIESDKKFNGVTYQVLYGGVSWGYSYSNVDMEVKLPEPSYVVVLAFVFAGCQFARYFRWLRGPSS